MIALLPVSIQMISLSSYGNVRPETVVQFRFPPQWVQVHSLSAVLDAPSGVAAPIVVRSHDRGVLCG